MGTFLTHINARVSTHRVIKLLGTFADDQIARSAHILRQLNSRTVPALDKMSGLMALSQEGDKQAYRRVLTACVPLAAAAARSAGVHDAAVPGVVRDMLLTVHRAMPTYDPSRPVGPWLQLIARRCAIDALRSREQSSARNADPRFANIGRQRISEAERHFRWSLGRHRDDHLGRSNRTSDAIGGARQ